MSFVASLFVLPVDQLPALADRAERAYDFLIATADEVDTDSFPWSGYGLVLTVTYLDEQGVDLMATPHREVAYRLSDGWGFTLLLTSEHQKHLPALDPARYPADELREYFAGMGTEMDPAAAGELARDAFSLLQTPLAALADDQVLIVHVG
ncbi:hypothetical protein AB0H43_29170 [Hamadaea sp. NPDC050747]|uniref:hypothetical protein n=1 Tax=Hamadaea sp. NPDC050747 TaxID=3155789 RepID=UPI0033F5F69E